MQQPLANRRSSRHSFPDRASPRQVRLSDLRRWGPRYLVRIHTKLYPLSGRDPRSATPPPHNPLERTWSGLRSLPPLTTFHTLPVHREEGNDLRPFPQVARSFALSESAPLLRSRVLFLG